MPYEIVFTQTAQRHYDELDARWRSAIKEAIKLHLRFEPTKVSKSRIKRLHDLEHPQFRLRVDDYRVFYDVEERRVGILSIVPKEDADAWLLKHGERSP